ncbi:MAG: helicase-exonuclease AddAB subunit AddA [Phycisphaerae bacterium]|nr:helicase-exonuclease AddAB subunit AddA [Phycisphaerae bacterium]
MPDAPARDRYAHLTKSQREAIQTTGRSLLVSAAAGAGKTTVLAERCAYLICDLPKPDRCGIDELLVVTFTDAAAGEMRTRIRKAIRQRRMESSQAPWLDQQLHLLESASISTIHSFCKTVIQQWFPQAGVDPQAAVLAEDEADLLRHETLDALFVELYGRDDEYGRGFQSLVDDYGGGNDVNIAEALLSIHGFAASLPEPQAWLERAVEALEAGTPDALCDRIDEIQHGRLIREVDLHIRQANESARVIETLYPIASMHADALREYRSQCEAWLDRLKAGNPDAWDEIAREVAGHKITTGRRPSKLPETEVAQFDAAKKIVEWHRDLLEKRLQDNICSFSRDEYIEGLQRILPYVRTIVRLVRDFDDRYQQAKAVQAAVDFNDLQRQAYRLLTENGDPSRPSKVALQLQKRYRHVLVDEFQDVDPLQEAILRLVSRETADPPEGNLFAVGDIKQSIYRFRLAEPALFTSRADAFSPESAIGKLIHLGDNFRSREGIIKAVNVVFAPLMSRSFGGSEYDENARLKAGACYPPSGGLRAFDGPAVELHLLEPIKGVAQASHADEEEADDTDATHGDSQHDELAGIEREAFLIGRRIQDWMGSTGERMNVADRPATPGGPPVLRPIEYRDIVILLRSMPHKAEPIANILRRMEIPVLIGRGESPADSTEFRDILSLLRVLDNRQQDIPLAAVLRSPLVGQPLTETEMLHLRLHEGEGPFHRAVLRCAKNGPDQELRSRLSVILATLDRWRTRIRRLPVAEVLWEILEETHYPAFVAGLPDGARRRERLIQIHNLAREFGQFRRQGLRRFLRFMDEMLAAERSPQQPAGAGGDDNAVRIMTVHTSKGLEFPVVIVADLSKTFNLSDTNRSVLIHRNLGIALRAANPQKRIHYPTLIHQLAVEDHRRESLSEELRVLYVALTRAREHLLLVGRIQLERLAAFRLPREPSAEGLPHLQLEVANEPLTWLLAALGAAPADDVRWPGDSASSGSVLVEVHQYPRTETDGWRTPPAVVPERLDALANFARLEPLPGDEPVQASDEAPQLIASLDASYPALELTTLPARVAVTELKRRWESWSDPDLRPGKPPVAAPAPAVPTFIEPLPAVQAVHRGLATHRFCQLIDLARPCDAADLAEQRRSLLEAGRLSESEASAVLLDDVAWFFSTALGQHIRKHAARVRRETAFVSRVAPDRYEPMVAAQDSRDVVLVRGTVDVLLCHEDHLEIVDYKTDAITAGDCIERSRVYEEQLDNYAKALQGILQRPVVARWLVFLQARCIVDLAARTA